MELNIEKTQQLEKLLAKPTLATQEHIPFLQNLIEDYPYFQPLHLLLAKASNGHNTQQNALTKAALYTNGSILHRVLHEPQQLQPVEEIKIVTYPNWNNQQQLYIASKNSSETPVAPVTITEAPEIENLEPLPHEVIIKEPSKAQEKLEVVEDVKPIVTEKVTVQDFVAPEIENLEPLPSEVIKVCDPTPETNDDTAPQEDKETDDQETFEEIGEVTLTHEHLSQPETEEATVEEEVIIDDSVNTVTDQNESLAEANFFAFEPSFETETVQEEVQETQEIEQLPVTIQPENIVEEVSDEHIISKYDDDKLPFTFLWWLAKTRKDHEQIFRPFASPAKTSSPTQDLQQQYVENIFHIQAPFEPGKEVEVPTTEKPTKESKIIDSFIKNDPQIKALKPHQINNENKAKRSAEDNYDMVSETLAQIYIEQMLYHKAIDTYQKLSLKFPEKSRYFADLIQSLEKKI
ncbi:hypothetical protein [Pedobacter sp.]|uniref:hypothetical protein n=1 Tax=Pedobacter sp. TaxID=1411316 RepID=UPI0031D0704B